MANAIPMIRRCARYGTPEGWQEYGPATESMPPTPSFEEEPCGNGERLPPEGAMAP